MIVCDARDAPPRRVGGLSYIHAMLLVSHIYGLYSRGYLGDAGDGDREGIKYERKY
jgi:hypothetical protein